VAQFRKLASTIRSLFGTDNIANGVRTLPRAVRREKDIYPAKGLGSTELVQHAHQKPYIEAVMGNAVR
jgi:hypothetical protein